MTANIEDLPLEAFVDGAADDPVSAALPERSYPIVPPRDGAVASFEPGLRQVRGFDTSLYFSAAGVIFTGVTRESLAELRFRRFVACLRREIERG